MSDDFSIDIVSGIDHNELLTAIDKVREDFLSTYHLGSNTQIDLNPDRSITITTNNKNSIKDICDSFESHLNKDGNSVTINNIESSETGVGTEVKHIINIIKGFTKDIADSIVDDIKDLKLEVDTTIHNNQVRVTGKNQADIDNIVTMINKNQEKYNTPIQITNNK